MALRKVAKWVLIGIAGSVLPPVVRAEVLDQSASGFTLQQKIEVQVSRDRACLVLDAQYPGYGFAQHKGYGTAQHQMALQKYGATAAHRRSFAPVRAVLLAQRSGENTDKTC